MSDRNSGGGRMGVGRVRRAFTLVELLVVIGIIALLITILLPSLNGARKKAQAIQCASNMRQIYLACQMFAQDNKGQLPTPHPVPETSATLAPNDPNAIARTKVRVWLHLRANAAGYADLKDDQGALWRYVGGENARKEILYCAGDSGEKLATWPSDPMLPRNYSYSFNYQIAIKNKDVNRSGNQILAGIRLGAMRGASDKIMIYEELAPNDTWNIIGRSSDDLPSARHGNDKALNAKRDINSKAFKYAGRGNYCFFDGHVVMMMPAEVDPSLTPPGPLYDQINALHRPLTAGDEL